MDLLDTISGSLMEGFFPAGWDLKKIDRCVDPDPRSITKRQRWWHRGFEPVPCASYADFDTMMGHEIAHALREHGRERASEQVAQQLGVSVLSVALGLGDAGAQLTQTLLDVTLSLPHSRVHETEADRIGVELAARSGYDPRAAVSLWQKMGKLGGGKPPEWMSTHPSDQTRIRDLQSYSERVAPLYEAARRR